jgi:hypothetical protein
MLRVLSYGRVDDTGPTEKPGGSPREGSEKPWYWTGDQAPSRVR